MGCAVEQPRPPPCESTHRTLQHTYEPRCRARRRVGDAGRKTRHCRRGATCDAGRCTARPAWAPSGAFLNLNRSKSICSSSLLVSERRISDTSAICRQVVETVAVCGGAGTFLTHRAIEAGADAFVTSDVSYHRFFDVLGTDGSPRMALVDAGHYETEVHVESQLVRWLSERFPTVEWLRTTARTSPVSTFIRAEER